MVKERRYLIEVSKLVLGDEISHEMYTQKM